MRINGTEIRTTLVFRGDIEDRTIDVGDVVKVKLVNGLVVKGTVMSYSGRSMVLFEGVTPFTTIRVVPFVEVDELISFNGVMYRSGPESL